MAGRITLSTTDEDEAVYQELEEDIEKLFGGKSGFWRSHLRVYDDKSRIKGKVKLIEQKIQEHKKQIEDLEMQKRGLEEELEKRGFDENSSHREYDEGTDEYWDKTCELIFERSSPTESSSLQGRYERWFDGRYDSFTRNFGEIPVSDFRRLLYDKAEERGYDDKVEKLRNKNL